MDPTLLGGGGGGGDNDGNDDVSNSSRRRRFGKFTDADLDKLALDLNELEKVMPALQPGASSSSSSGGDSTIFVESSLANDQFNINNTNFNEALPPPQTQSCFARSYWMTFNEFLTTMLPPPPTSSTTLCTQHGVTAANHSSTSTTTAAANYDQQALAREIQESLVMIEEMADHEHDHQGSGAASPVLGNCNDPTENVDIDMGFSYAHACHSDVAGRGGNGIGSFSEQAHNYGHGILGDGHGLQGDHIHGIPRITFFGGPPPSVRYFVCLQNSDGNGTEMIKSRRNKRRYKGVIETVEETARRVERTKIKNRGAAAKAHERKQACEAKLQTQILKLRKKNKFLKNMVMFLQWRKRVDVHPQLLRRTISGPI